ncbi:metalloregulator ArsR/SmtB family transcription factor [Vibrio sp. ZSDE26]|uniref:Metalloregulator ArsR/SmtB family transcription factor n=1 Tax=Vibrio amylolyticus TaxID=2847292 RepID=A0A9X1XI13_9VIBR|nr:metalloregulator ArsR/SmtB family transcription factor [Vibrio amylolyticus]MCK6263387.1 metalloregulator ArsR/SmtB family transcription factor [Vibrio amylolyticus]
MNTACNQASSAAFSATKQELVQEKNLATLSKALSHPARIRILKILLTLDNLNGCLNSDLVSELGLAQSTVSEHLRILKQAGFITAEPIPPRMCYSVNREKVCHYSTLLSSIFN